MTTRCGVEGFEAGFEKTFLSGAASMEVRAPRFQRRYAGYQLRRLGHRLQRSAGQPMRPGDLRRHERERPHRAEQCYHGASGHRHDYGHHREPVGSFAALCRHFWMPSSRFFAQGYIQVDVDASGNEVLAGPTAGPFTNRRPPLRPDLPLRQRRHGYWLRRGDCSRLITSIACMGEIHINESLASGGAISDGTVAVPPYNYSLVDFTAGLHMDMGQQCSVTVGYVAPLSGGAEREFNGELRGLRQLQVLPGHGRRE